MAQKTMAFFHIYGCKVICFTLLLGYGVFNGSTAAHAKSTQNNTDLCVSDTTDCPYEEFEWIVLPSFDRIEPFNEGLAAARKKYKAPWGFLDVQGKWAFTLPTDIQLALIPPNVTWEFHEGMLPIRKDSKYGFVNTSGKIVIPPRFTKVFHFSEGLAKVTEDGKHWGFIDLTGEWVLDPTFKNASSFREGVAFAKQSEKWGVLDKTGAWIIPPRFNSGGFFSEGLASVESTNQIPQNQQFAPNIMPLMRKQNHTILGGFYDEQGTVIPPAAHFFGYIDITGDWIIPPRYLEAQQFVNGTAVVKTDKKTWCFINPQGEKIGQLQGNNLKINRKDSLFEVRHMGYGKSSIAAYYDQHGKMVFPQCDVIENCGEFSEGVLPFKDPVTKKWGYLNLVHDWAISPRFDETYPVTNGLATVRVGEKYGVIRLKHSQSLGAQ